MTNVSPSEWTQAAKRRLSDARYLLEDGRNSSALSQLYFAIFYACKALLTKRNLDLRTHSSVVGSIGRFSNYRQRLDTSLPSQLLDERELCDYELMEPSDEHARKRLRETEKFISEARRLANE